MSSNTAKVGIGAAALIGVGFATGGFGLAGAAAGSSSGLGAGVVGTATQFGIPSSMVAGGGGGFFGSLTGFQAASLGLGALSFGSNILGAMSADAAADLQRQQIEVERQRAEIQANVDRAAALERFNRMRGTIIANGGARGIDPTRDQMAQIEKGEEYLKDELGAIAVNQSTGNIVAGLQMAQASNKGRAGVIQGVVGGGRSLLGAYMDYEQSRTA